MRGRDPSEDPPRPHPWPVDPRFLLGSVCHGTSSLVVQLVRHSCEAHAMAGAARPPHLPARLGQPQSVLRVLGFAYSAHFINRPVQCVAAVTGFFHGRRVLSASVRGILFLTALFIHHRWGPGGSFHLLYDERACACLNGPGLSFPGICTWSETASLTPEASPGAAAVLYPSHRAEGPFLPSSSTLQPDSF